MQHEPEDRYDENGHLHVIGGARTFDLSDRAWERRA